MKKKILKKWNINEKFNVNAVKKISNNLGISSVLSKILYNRGLTNSEAISKFLWGGLEKLHNPKLLLNAEKAAELIIKNAADKKKFLIYADRDVDGISALTIIYNILLDLGINEINYFIPSGKFGYGLHIEILKKYFQFGIDCIICVDCGTNDVEQVNYIKKENKQIIIIDHHTVTFDNPLVDAMVNPKSEKDTYPEKMLSSAGIAFKVAQIISEKINLDFNLEGYSKKNLPYVALSNISDVVPLTGENRILTKQGLEFLLTMNNPGITTLIKTLGIKENPTASEIAWRVIPVLNAAGRMAKADVAVQLMLSKTSKEAEKYISRLFKLNQQRKLKGKVNYNIIKEEIPKQVDLEKDKVIVIAVSGIEHGVTGILANRIKMHYNKPAIVLIIENNEALGAGRSIENFNLYEALDSCKDILLKYGGHKLAVGLTLNPDNICELKKRLNDYAEKHLNSNDFIPIIDVDLEINPDEINFILLEELKLLEPTGNENHKPIFYIPNVLVTNTKQLGNDGSHLRLGLKKSGVYFNAIAWDMGNLIYNLRVMRTHIDILFTIEAEEWFGEKMIQLNILDLKLH